MWEYVYNALSLLFNMLIDIHCHLDLLGKETSLDEAVALADKKGVLIVAQGVGVESNREVLKMREKYKNVKACFGLYPIDALKLSEKEVDEELKFIEKNKDKIFGIGEVGIDFKESVDEKEHVRQEETFRKIVRLVKKIDKPLIVHSRKAEARVIEILEEEKAEKVVMHCFNGNFKLVKKIVDNKWFLTIPTCVKSSEHFQKIAKEVPIEQLFCETDSPYLHPDKTWPNTPANVEVSYWEIARIKGLKVDEVEKKLEGNLKNLRLFNIG